MNFGQRIYIVSISRRNGALMTQDVILMVIYGTVN